MTVRRSRAWSLALVLAGVWLSTRRARSYAHLHPELRAPLLRVRTPSTTPTVARILQTLMALAPDPPDIDVDRHDIPGADGAPDVPVDVHRPTSTPHHQAAALLYIHGGGFMIGSARASRATCASLADELGIVVINVDYRLVPDGRFPAALEDCYTALRWMQQHADALRIDPTRIAVMGESAGGCLAAGLAQLAHDRGEVEPALQVLAHPMLDDRTVLVADHGIRGELLWTPGSNRLAWTSYLGHRPTREGAPPYAAPARRQDLGGLAPAWIGVGTLDLLHPEATAYADRLDAAEVPCELHEVDGGYHGFDGMQPGASVSTAFRASLHDAIRRGLQLG